MKLQTTFFKVIVGLLVIYLLIPIVGTFYFQLQLNGIIQSYLRAIH
ncbi:hypothetical protein ACFVRR_11035 [Gottfriedia sp. NPDC057948]